jgi:spore maturation protein CgeB
VTPASRVVVVGQPATGGLRDSLVSAFVTLGWQVDTIDWGPWRPNILAAAAFRAPRLGAGFRRLLRREADDLSHRGPVALVLVVKGPFFDERTIEYYRSRLSAPVVCWNPDDPLDFALSNHGAGLPAAIGAYDAYVTWSEDVADHLRSQCANVMVIPFAWDPEVHRPTPGRGLAVGRIVFVGTGTDLRVRLLQQIAHLRPLVFGNGWPAVQGVEVRPPVLAAELSAIVGEAKWNLNVLRPQNVRSHNMRTFEIPGAGGNQVAPHTMDHARFLGEDTRTVLFRSQGELISILQRDPDHLPLRQSGLLDRHTYVDRVAALLTMLRLRQG